MKFGAFTACLHDRTLPDALNALAELGLTSAEVNSGGFLDYPHIPVDAILASVGAAEDYLGIFEGTGIALTGLNCNGNPLHADPAVRQKHADDLRRSIRAAGRLGIKRVVAMSGLPAGEPGGNVPSWSVNPWDSVWLDVLDYQWSEVVAPFWTEIDALAGENDVKVAIEMHPHNVVFNPATLLRLIEMTGATNVGAEMDPSHLFWQGMEPVAVIDYLGDLVVHAAAKDIRVNDACKINGVLDDRFRRVPAEQDPLSLGGRYTLNTWPDESSWQFVAVGRGHDVDYWATFLQALERVDPDMAVNIEHEDFELDQMEGLSFATTTLLKAAERD
jgi:sugar phosphate isomerase/epimerase